MFCQLEILRDCLPPSVRRTLDELPESLDETYERVLKEIKRPNRDHARRLMQCLVAAIRPLDVEELSEVLAVDFDDAEGIPKLKTNWRWEDEEQALLTSCSSLITIVKTGDSRIVQFSHFSVKEYLISTRLASSSGDVLRYHIILEPAHTILAQACMSVLLQPDDCVDENGVRKTSPLAGYAARHWVAHAQFEKVSSFLRKAMESLFDVDKPYFATWLQLHDIDTPPNVDSSSLYWVATLNLSPYSPASTKSSPTPLYYAALCGFKDLVEHLVIKYPRNVNTDGGYYKTPLVAALAGRHFQTAELLYLNGGHLNVRGYHGRSTLHSAPWYGDLEMVRVLLDYKADVNARDGNNWTPIHTVSRGCFYPKPLLNIPQLWPDVARLLLGCGLDVNALGNGCLTPLHLAAEDERADVARVLLEHGASVGAEDDEGRTPLHIAAGRGRVEVARTLLEHGANVGAKDSRGRTPFQIASTGRYDETMELLSEYGIEGVE